MCEVNKLNFDKLFPSIVSRIDECAFLAIDTEFTGLRLSGTKKTSMFDSANDRYKILKTSSSHFIICQLGLCAFVPIPNRNSYEAYAYNFYICPSAHGLKDSDFSMQVSSIEYLCAHNFDFNKFFYKGIPYLNEEEEKRLNSQLKSGNSLTMMEDNLNDRQLTEVCSNVAKWLESAKEGSSFKLEYEAVISSYFIHSIIRKTFNSVWTWEDDEQKIHVEKMNPETRKEREMKETSLNDKFFMSELGFSRIFKHLVRAKKPLIGHNLMLDLLLIHNRFYRPLPATFNAFKTEINKLFPTVFDTRHIAHEMKKELERKQVNEAFSLQELFENLSSRTGCLAVLYSPSISLAPGFEYYEEYHPHEAGYDAYISGYVFLRLAHFYSNCNFSSNAMRTLSPAQHLSCVECFCNRLNLIRAHINFINLAGDDPLTVRPQWLVIQSKTSIDLKEISENISRFGCVDIRSINGYQALIAVANYRCAKDIVQAFRDHSVYRVSKYSLIHHSCAVRSVLWFSVFLLGGLGVALIASGARR